MPNGLDVGDGDHPPFLHIRICIIFAQYYLELCVCMISRKYMILKLKLKWGLAVSYILGLLTLKIGLNGSNP